MQGTFTGGDAMDIQRRVQENLERQQRLFEELTKKEIALPTGSLTVAPSPVPFSVGGVQQHLSVGGGPPPSQADRAFDQIDTNKDGVITRSEWLTAMRPAGPSSPNTAASVGTDFGIGAGNRMPGSPLPSVPPVVPMGNGGPMYPAFGLGRSPSPPRPEVMDPNHPAHHPPPGMFGGPGLGGPAGIERMVNDCWQRDNVIADQMKQLNALRDQNEQVSKITQETQRHASEEMTKMQQKMISEDHTHRQQLRLLEDDKAREAVRARQAEDLAQRTIAEQGNTTHAADQLRAQLADRDNQLHQTQVELDNVKLQLMQAKQRAEEAEAGRKNAENQGKMIHDRNNQLEAHVQTFSIQMAEMQSHANTASAAAMLAQQQQQQQQQYAYGSQQQQFNMQQQQFNQGMSAVDTDAVTSAFIAELINLEQFIRSSAHTHLGMALFPQTTGMPTRVPVAAAPMLDKCRRAVIDLVHELRGAKGQLQELRLATDVESNRAVGLDASKAQLHQELVEACRRLSELHNRVTLLEVENATVTSRSRELEEKDTSNNHELDSRRKFVYEIWSQMKQSERSVRDVSKNATWSHVMVHQELEGDASWHTVKVALSEQATGCAVALQSCVRGLTGLEDKLSEAASAVERTQEDSRSAVLRCEEQAEQRVQSVKESEARTREVLSNDCDRRLAHSEEQNMARLKAAADAEMSKLSDQQNVINELEHHNNSVRMQLEDSKLEIAHSHERLLAFERCNAENARLIQALEVRSKELENAIGTMIAPSKHAALQKELEEEQFKLVNVTDEKDAATSELESLLTVIRELRFKMQEGDEGNKALEKENMKLCWQHVEWKTQLGAMQDAIGKRDRRLLDCESESEQRKAELMQVVSRSKSAQGDLKALQELVETIEGQRQTDTRKHLTVVSNLQRTNEDLQQREAALRAHLEQLDAQLQRSRHLSLSGDTSKAVAGVAAVADELSGRLSRMRSTSPARGLGVSSPLRR